MRILGADFFDEVSKYQDDGLRDYQIHHKKDIYQSWKETNSILLQMPTGTGKTRLFVSMINDFKRYHELHRTKIDVLIVTHRKELVEQIKNELYRNYGIRSTLITADNKDSHRNPLPVCVASIQTLQRRLEQHWYNYPFDFLIIDEAHHTKAATYKKIVDAYSYAKLLGVTATPYRLNGEGFTNEFHKLIISPSVKSFIEAGWLSNYDYYSIKEDNELYKGLENIPLDKYGEYATTPLWNYIKHDSIRAEVVGSYLKYAKGKKGIIYTISKAHNKQLCEEFRECGVSAFDIDSDTSAEERKDIVQRFRNGEIDVICNVDIFTEGFDCPDVEVIQLARPTKSLGLYLQQVGRGLRIAPGKKKVLFLDNVGLHNRFGFPASKRMWKKHYVGTEIEESTKYISKENDEPFELEKHYTYEEGFEELSLIESTGVNDIIEEAKTGYLVELEKKLKVIVDSIFETNRRVFKEYVEVFSEDHLGISSEIKEDLVVPCSFVMCDCLDEEELEKRIKREFKPIIKNGSIIYESYQDIDEYIREKQKMILERFKSELSKAREQDYKELENYNAEQLRNFFEVNYGFGHPMTQKFSLFCDNHLEDLTWSEIVKKWDTIEYKKKGKTALEKEERSSVKSVIKKNDVNEKANNNDSIEDPTIKFKINDRVKHSNYGIGTVVGIKGRLYNVTFDNKATICVHPLELNLVKQNNIVRTPNHEAQKDDINTKRIAKFGDIIRLKSNGKVVIVVDESIGVGSPWLLVKYSDNRIQRISNNYIEYDIIDDK